MGRPFDQGATIIRNGDLFVRLKPVERGSNAQQIVINPRPALVGSSKNLASRRKISFKRSRIDQYGGGARVGAVPMQSAEPLQQDIRWARIRDEKIGINIERLLGGLGRDRNDTGASSPYAKYA